jgi:hypothetical protein
MNAMVMDVEGTDGRERGEDQVNSTILSFPPRLISSRRTLSVNLRCSP